jgi:Protein of unknown function (DUF2867)
MRIYADVAGLGKRYLIVLPFLTPAIASLWVGTVTPIPPGLARPLIESLECDAVMRNHDIDTVIARPAGGLTNYRRAVALALSRGARGLTESAWSSLPAAPSEPLPSDPDWAGEIVETDERSASSRADADELWKVVETTRNAGGWYSFPVGSRPRRGDERWSVEEIEPGSLLRMHAEVRAPGEAWLEMRVSAEVGGGSRYDQRAVFFPRGIPGRLYWYVTRPVHALALRAMARKVTEAAG